MKTALIAAAALLVASPLVSQASDHFVKYDSTFGMSLEGAYGWSGRSGRADVGGGLIGLHQNIYSGSVYSQVSLTTGCFSGSETTHRGWYDGEAITSKNKVTSIPVLAGYTLSVPMTDYIQFYVGVKAGISIVNDKMTYSNPSLWDREKTSGAKFTYTAGAGFKFSVGENTDLKIGYEQYRTQYGSSSNPYHMIQAGILWNF